MHVVGTVLGATALALMIAGVILNNVTVLVATTTAVVAVSVVTTAHHLVETGPRPSFQANR